MSAVHEGQIRITLLGGFEVKQGERRLPDTGWRRRKAARLLQRLALERRLLKEQAIEALWPGWLPKAGANNLYRTIYALRRTLDEALGEGTAEATFKFQSGILSLSDRVWVDAEAFEQLCARADETPPAERRDLLERALALYKGPLLPDERYTEWTLAWRTRLRRRHRDASLALAKQYRDDQVYDSAARLLVPLVRHEPTDEPVHRELMRIHALAGRPAAALRQYETCVAALAETLSLAPAPQTTALRDDIRDGVLSPPAEPAPEDKLTITTPLFGREQELRLIAERLANPLCRLLTLVGPAGIGKTQLARQAAADIRSEFAHGAVLVSLASGGSPSRLVPAIAEALQRSLPGGGPPEAHLAAYLRERQMLLVLDNFEHLGEAAPLLSDILTRAPRLKVLVTSREQLNLQHEWVVEVGALACPEDTDLARIETYSGVQLFLHAARRLRPDFALTDRNRPAVACICRLTGGLPLALELAAGWVRTLPATAIADEVARDLDVLSTRMQDVPERHRSLRVVFEEAWQHLTPEEQQVFARLAVFRGAITREAAEQVAGATLPILSGLVRKSHLKRTPEGRYELHELLRQFGMEKLGEEDKEALARIEREIDDRQTPCEPR